MAQSELEPSVIHWLADNKEWLFSGAGVAVVGGLLAWLIRRLRQTTKTQDTPRFSGPLQVILESPAPPLYTPPAGHAPLDPQAIFDAIQSAPLLQQPEVEKHYHGLRVEWSGTLISAVKRADDNISLLLRCTSSGVPPLACSFEVNPAIYPGLGLLRADGSVRVAGVIDSISDEIIHLVEVQLVEYGNSTI